MKKNKWMEWRKYPFNITYNTTAIDPIRQKIYMFTGCGKIMEIDLKTKNWKTSTDTFGSSYNSNSIFMNGKYYIFGALGKNNEGYLCWDPITQIGYFNNDIISYTNNLRVHSIHHIRRVNTLCLFIDTYPNKILYLSVKYDNWFIYKRKEILQCDCSVITKNIRYIICLEIK